MAMPLQPPAQYPLEPDRPTMAHWIEAASRFALDHIEALPQGPACGSVGEDGRRIAEDISIALGDDPLPGGMEGALAVLRRATAASLSTVSPGYVAYIPGGGLYAAAVADFLAGCINRFTGLTTAAPALVRLEADVLSWLAEEFGYGAQARGIFTSGGSLANFSAIVTARTNRLGEESDLRQATAYTSTEVHHSVSKAFRLAGFPAPSLRLCPCDSRFRVIPEGIARRIGEDRKMGRNPFLIVASAGTVNTGAVDPLPELASLAVAEKLWLHVDGAYGGAFELCPEGRARLDGIARADSITFDPHKGLFLPYGTGCLLVREGQALRIAHQTAGAYLQDFDAMGRTGEAPSPCDHGPELSRPYRGLRLWLALALHGAKPFREALSEKLALAQRLHTALRELSDHGAPIEIVAEPQLSIVPFRLTRRRAETLESWDARNAELLRTLNEKKRVYLSSTGLPTEDGPAFTLRACVLSFRTHSDRVDALVEDLAQALRDNRS